MFDAHGHLSDPRIADFVIELCASLRDDGLEHIVLGGVNPSEWDRQELLKNKFPEFVTHVIGIHPWTVRDTNDAGLEVMFAALTSRLRAAKAMGEVGLDFHSDNSTAQKQRQAHWCKRQLQLAEELKKPVVLHVVKGHDIMQAMLRDFKGPAVMVHGFRGHAQVAKFYMDRGYLLSLGMRSFAKLAPEDFAWLPKSGFVIESDAPIYHDGSLSLSEVRREWIAALNGAGEFLAKVWKIDAGEVWHLARTNMNRFLNGLD